MDFDAIRSELVELLGVPLEAIVDDSVLDDFENWDSLTKVSVIASMIDKCGLPLDDDALDGARTIGDLRRLFERQGTGEARGS